MSLARADCPDVTDIARSIGDICLVKHSFIQRSSIGCFTTAAAHGPMQAMLEHLTNDERRERISELIARIGQPKNALADEIGVSAQAITGWERTGRIAKASIAKLCALGGKPTEYLMVRNWREGGGMAANAPDHESDDVALALIVLAGWIRETRPAEAPLLSRDLAVTADKVRQYDPLSPLRMMIQALEGAPPSAAVEPKSRKKSSPRSGRPS